MLISQLRIIVGVPAFLECGGLPPLLRLTQWRHLNCLGGTDLIAKREQAPALQRRLSPVRGEDNEEEEEERSLDPGEARGAHKSRCVTRRAKLRRGRKKSGRFARDDKSRVTGRESRLPPAAGRQP